MNDADKHDPMMRALAALPVRAPDAIAAERVRLRARLALRLRPASPVARALGHGWYVAEPWVVGVVVIVFLGWTLDRMAILLG